MASNRIAILPDSNRTVMCGAPITSGFLKLDWEKCVHVCPHTPSLHLNCLQTVLVTHEQCSK